MKKTGKIVKDTHGIQSEGNHAVSVLIPESDYEYLKNIAKKRRVQSVSSLIREIVGKAVDSGFGE